MYLRLVFLTCLIYVERVINYPYRIYIVIHIHTTDTNTIQIVIYTTRTNTHVSLCITLRASKLTTKDNVCLLITWINY